MLLLIAAIECKLSSQYQSPFKKRKRKKEGKKKKNESLQGCTCSIFSTQISSVIKDIKASLCLE